MVTTVATVTSYTQVGMPEDEWTADPPDYFGTKSYPITTIEKQSKYVYQMPTEYMEPNLKASSLARSWKSALHEIFAQDPGPTSPFDTPFHIGTPATVSVPKTTSSDSTTSSETITSSVSSTVSDITESSVTDTNSSSVGPATFEITPTSGADGVRVFGGVADGAASTGLLALAACLVAVGVAVFGRRL